LLNKYGSSETLSVFGQKIVDLLSPVEMRFRGRWRSKEGQDNFLEWRRRVNIEYSKIQQSGYQRPILPEAQHLKQIEDEMRNRFEVDVPTAEVVSNTFNECLNMLEGNFSSYSAYMLSRFGRKDIREILVEEMSRGFYEGRHTRGLGIDVNPPESSSEWRK